MEVHWLAHQVKCSVFNRSHVNSMNFIQMLVTIKQKAPLVKSDASGKIDKSDLHRSIRMVMEKYVLEELQKLLKKGKMVLIVFNEASLLRH